ncbi:MAG: farnesyl diphosphate synthase [Beijerinckiaceae bacterium]
MSSTQPIPQDALAFRLATTANAIEVHLAALLVSDSSPGEIERPALLMEAMRHGALAGGKRMRPFLVIETARMLGVEGEGPLRTGAALELVHCYSLVHDDLPAMDDDDMRRGKPTVHKAYDDAMGVLVGDGLLTLAFDHLADRRTSASTAVQVELVRLLARGAGAGGMVGGQLLDLAAEGRYAGRATLPAGEAGIALIQSLKTGALIRAGCALGAALARAGVADRRALDAYSSALGRAFQIRDDLLDHEGDATTLGKAAGKDAAAGKATFVSLLGPDGAKARLASVTQEGRDALGRFGERAAMLSALLAFNQTRRS